MYDLVPYKTFKKGFDVNLGKKKAFTVMMYLRNKEQHSDNLVFSASLYNVIVI